MARISVPSPAQALRTLHQPYQVPLRQVPAYEVEQSRTPAGSQRVKQTYYTPQGVYAPQQTSPLGLLLLAAAGFWLYTHPQQTAAFRVAVAGPTQPLARTATGQALQVTGGRTS